jgi:hypothetical protein
VRCRWMKKIVSTPSESKSASSSDGSHFGSNSSGARASVVVSLGSVAVCGPRLQGVGVHAVVHAGRGLCGRHLYRSGG